MNIAQSRSRRWFIGGMVCGAAGGTLAYRMGQPPVPVIGQKPVAMLPPKFDQMLTSLQGVRDVPQTLLAQYGDPQQIYGWLMGRLGRVPGTQVDDFSGAVHQRIAADYRDGRLCDFHGWPMSETECALIAARAQRTPLTGPEERSFSNAMESSWLDVRNWGPQSTRRGHVFNPQPDGHGGIWFQASGDVSSAVIVINGVENPITLNDSGFTTGVHGAVLARLINDPGPHAIWVYDFSRHRKQKIGDFIVDP